MDPITLKIEQLISNFNIHEKKLQFFFSYSAAAFFFQACLFLVLSRWKPSQDDSALFYVIGKYQHFTKINDKFY